MIICLGENIRTLRTERGITQDKLGYELGVSAQAVSRWENGTTYPDITVLPMLADFFGVSLDELMGYGKEMDSSDREAFFKKIYALQDAGQTGEISKAYDAILRKHPNDVYILHGKAWFLYSQIKESKNAAIGKEIISLCNKVGCCNKPDIQCGTSALLVRVYAETGYLDKAKQIASSLPSFEVGRELMIAHCLPESEKAEYYQYLIERFEGKIALFKKRLRT